MLGRAGFHEFHFINVSLEIDMNKTLLAIAAGLAFAGSALAADTSNSAVLGTSGSTAVATGVNQASVYNGGAAAANQSHANGGAVGGIGGAAAWGNTSTNGGTLTAASGSGGGGSSALAIQAGQATSNHAATATNTALVPVGNVAINSHSNTLTGSAASSGGPAGTGLSASNGAAANMTVGAVIAPPGSGTSAAVGATVGGAMTDTFGAHTGTGTVAAGGVSNSGGFFTGSIHNP